MNRREKEMGEKMKPVWKLSTTTDSCHGRVSGINNIFFPMFLLFP